MGDNDKEIKPEETKSEPQTQEVKLTITYRIDGNVGVEGPITNEPFALWLLDKAKDTIKMFNIQRTQPKITPAKGGLMNFARRFHR